MACNRERWQVDVLGEMCHPLVAPQDLMLLALGMVGTPLSLLGSYRVRRAAGISSESECWGS